MHAVGRAYGPPYGEWLLSLMDVCNARGRAKPLPTVLYTPQALFEEGYVIALRKHWRGARSKAIHGKNILPYMCRNLISNKENKKIGTQSFFYSRKLATRNDCYQGSVLQVL